MVEQAIKGGQMEMIHIRNEIYPNEEKNGRGRRKTKSSLPLNSNP
jgi:hypothetical protein